MCIKDRVSKVRFDNFLEYTLKPTRYELYKKVVIFDNCSNIMHFKMHVRSLSFRLILIIRFLKFESASFSNDQNVYFLFDFETLLWQSAQLKFDYFFSVWDLNVHILLWNV